MIAGWATLLVDLRDFAVEASDAAMALDVCALQMLGCESSDARDASAVSHMLARLARELTRHAAESADVLCEDTGRDRTEAVEGSAGACANVADLLLRTVATVRAITAMRTAEG